MQNDTMVVALCARVWESQLINVDFGQGVSLVAFETERTFFDRKKELEGKKVRLLFNSDGFVSAVELVGETKEEVNLDTISRRDYFAGCALDLSLLEDGKNRLSYESRIETVVKRANDIANAMVEG